MNEKFRVDRVNIKSLVEAYKLAIPPFQRRFVWGNEKKNDLIDSLNRSFPIGAIILFYNKEKDSYLVVDGLQRINTIKSYLSNPSNIVKFKTYVNKMNNDLSAFIKKYNLKESKFKNCIKSWYENLATEDENSSNFKFRDFKFLQEKLEKNNFNEITKNLESFQELRNILLKNIDIENENIALITYSGDLDDLPEIFTKINQKAISLTGYEILHSLWYEYIIPNDEFGFEKYRQAFKDLTNETQDFLKLDDTYFDTFNMYMNISSLQKIIKNQLADETIDFFEKSSSTFILKGETIFDIYSTIFKKTTNKINKTVMDLFDKKPNYDFLLNVNEAIVDTVSVLDSYLYNNQELRIYSKYFYIYCFYFLFVNMYDFRPEDNICKKKRDFSSDLVDGLKEKIKEASDNTWFKDENRQISFFNSKIEKLQNEI